MILFTWHLFAQNTSFRDEGQEGVFRSPKPEAPSHQQPADIRDRDGRAGRRQTGSGQSKGTGGRKYHGKYARVTSLLFSKVCNFRLCCSTASHFLIYIHSSRLLERNLIDRHISGCLMYRSSWFFAPREALNCWKFKYSRLKAEMEGDAAR